MGHVVEVANLQKRYGSTVAVDDVSFDVEQGEIFGILGPNGAGKTTTVECIAGLRKPESGTVSVLGRDPQVQRAELTQRLGVQLQESQLQDHITVAEALDLYASFYDNPADWNALIEQLGLTDKRDTRYSNLSGGQKQRLSIALALVGSPEVAILDELTTGLDPQARRDTWALVEGVRDSGVTIILVTHFMDEAERLCDRLAVIDSGRLAAIDTPQGLIASVAGGNRVRFRSTDDFDDSRLADLPDVHTVSHDGADVVVTGTDDLLFAVVRALDEYNVRPQQFRMEQANLEDAFVALTGKQFESVAVS
jgi:ABC-2 type transport system ATP-binding protein